jgi:hypothetical protein
MKTCVKCNESKSESEFYLKRGKPNSWCKKCTNSSSAIRISEWRKRTKQKLLDHFGGMCKDCNESYPPFMMDFDHRDSAEKEFAISQSSVANWEKILGEAAKCDLVCANCHRMRSHIRQCHGCEHCKDVIIAGVYPLPDKQQKG